MEPTIEFYNEHAQEFFDSTFYIDMTEHIDRFTKHLLPGAKILDLGCGSGRDICEFKRRGFQVEGLDASEELVKLALERTGSIIRLGQIENLDVKNEYDGIWCCASLLHVDKLDLMDVVDQIYDALKDYGFVYASFKYGDSERNSKGRYFVDFNETSVRKLFLKKGKFGLRECYISYDLRPGREKERWINIIVEKNVHNTDWKSRSLNSL